MSSALEVTEPTLTAEQFAERADPGYPEELVRGHVVSMPPPKRRHGQICAKVVRLLANFVADHNLGQVLSNDAGVITERSPDSVRGPDVSYYSYARLPKGPAPHDYAREMPEIVIEVFSEHDRWPKVLAKVAEYLDAGVVIAVILDDSERAAHVYRADAPVKLLGASDVLDLSGILPDFPVRVSEFFE